jgi:hypothetical protein
VEGYRRAEAGLPQRTQRTQRLEPLMKAELTRILFPRRDKKTLSTSNQIELRQCPPVAIMFTP